MIKQSLDRGRVVTTAASKSELVRHMRNQREIDFDETKCKLRPDGKWQYVATKSKKKE